MIGGGELRRAIPDQAFEVLIKSPTFVLLGATPQPSLDQANQRCWVERPLQKRYVAEQVHKTGSARITLNSAAVLRQNDKGEVRPRWLGRHPVGQGAKVSISDSLLCNDGGVGTIFELLKQFSD